MDDEEAHPKRTGKKSTAAKTTKAKRTAQVAASEDEGTNSTDEHEAPAPIQESRKGRGAKSAGRGAKAAAQRKQVEEEEKFEESEPPRPAEPAETVQSLVPEADGDDIAEEAAQAAHSASVATMDEDEVTGEDLAALEAAAAERAQSARLPGPIREANRSQLMDVPLLAYEVFMRYGTKMPLWPEDEMRPPVPRNKGASIKDRANASRSTPLQPRRAGAPRPKFPTQLLSVPRCTYNVEPNARYHPEEDSTLLIWMIRAFPLFNSSVGVTSYQSPCLWHWAQQMHLLTQRTWESMKSRARQVLVKYITGAQDVPDDLFDLIGEHEYFTFDGRKLTSFNRLAVDRDNEASKNQPDAQQLLSELDDPPPAVPTRKGKRPAIDITEGEGENTNTMDTEEASGNNEDGMEGFGRSVEDDPAYNADAASSEPNKRRKAAESN